MGVLKNLFGKKEPKEHPLRAMALKATAADLELSPTPESPKVFGMIMEQQIPMAGSATLVAFTDGSVSMYWGDRGGIIGAGQHDSVRVAAQGFLSLGQTTYDQASTAEPENAKERIRFIWKGFNGDRYASATESEFLSNGHLLSTLFAAAQDVVTQIRLVDQSR